MKKILNRKNRLIILFIVLAELLSIFTNFIPTFGQIIFGLLALIILSITLVRLEYGVWILLAELFIGSKGYLFYLSLGDNQLSIRIAIWIIVMSVWFGKLVAGWIKDKKLPKISAPKPASFFYYYLALFFFILFGLVSGFLNHNNFKDIFLDFNGWLYFTLIFPLSAVIKDKENIRSLLEIFFISALWLSFKTFFTLYAFSHNLMSSSLELYQWIRQTGVGEITQVQGGFYRVFFQSHVFALIGLFIAMLLLAESLKDKTKKRALVYFLISTAFLTVTLISFSRSFWIGLAVGLIFCLFSIYKIYGGREFLKTFFIFPASLILAAAFMFAIVKFPFPQPLGGFDAAFLFSQRLSEGGEAAISSRWQLLRPLESAIKKSPIWGQGFGSTVTYKSSDPRILEQTPDGLYTTYAFEWGWLDIWLKLGLFGLISYLVLIFKIIISAYKIKTPLAYGLALGLIVISAVSFFSPYTNHPLGIGYLLITSVIISRLISPRLVANIQERPDIK